MPKTAPWPVFVWQSCAFCHFLWPWQGPGLRQVSLQMLQGDPGNMVLAHQPSLIPHTGRSGNGPYRSLSFSFLPVLTLRADWAHSLDLTVGFVGEWLDYYWGYVILKSGWPLTETQEHVQSLGNPIRTEKEEEKVFQGIFLQLVLARMVVQSTVLTQPRGWSRAQAALSHDRDFLPSADPNPPKASAPQSGQQRVRDPSQPRLDTWAGLWVPLQQAPKLKALEVALWRLWRQEIQLLSICLHTGAGSTGNEEE